MAPITRQAVKAARAQAAVAWLAEIDTDVFRDAISPQEAVRRRTVNAQSSPLLLLPQELRDIILEHAMASRPNPRTMHQKFPALSRVSHQLRAEAFQVFFKSSIFKLPIVNIDVGPTEYCPCWQRVPAEYKKVVRRVKITGLHAHKREQAVEMAKKGDGELGVKDGTCQFYWHARRGVVGEWIDGKGLGEVASLDEVSYVYR